MRKGFSFLVKNILLSLFLTSVPVCADEVSSEQAVFAVNMWRLTGAHSSMRGALSCPNGEVSSLVVDGDVKCHVVSLENGGFVITSGNDCDPVAIRGFSNEGTFDASVDSPLKNLLVSSSVSGRGDCYGLSYGASAGDSVSFVKKKVELTALQCGNSFGASPSWKKLLSPSALKFYESGKSSVDDVCVAPFVEAKWNQEDFAGKALYNYYTPGNYPCGCVATAMAQIMRHYEYPKHEIPRKSGAIYIDSDEEPKEVYSYGGIYDWANMPYVPSSSISDLERQAIGKLTYDCGVSVEMTYTSQGSGSVASYAAEGFIDFFDYRNAKFVTSDYYPYSDISTYTNLYKRAILSNLNAGFPVLLAIREGLYNGHAVVADGYGYVGDSLYYHLNMGWGGIYNLWYTIPEIQNEYNFNVLSTIVYNIFPTNAGEIVSGRITDSSRRPLGGVRVKVVSGNKEQTVLTSASGIWAAIVESSKSCTVSAEARGYIPETGTTEIIRASVDAIYPQEAVVGNIWDCDFVLDEAAMSFQKINSFRVGEVSEDGTRRLCFGFASDLVDLEVYFSGEVNGSYTLLPSSAVSLSDDGYSATVVLDGEKASKGSGFVQVLGR